MLGSFAFFTIFMGSTFYFGPNLSNAIVRYSLAGTSALVLVELLTHAIDTVNMKSKVHDG